jgi:hypothetical protein
MSTGDLTYPDYLQILPGILAGVSSAKSRLKMAGQVTNKLKMKSHEKV